MEEPTAPSGQAQVRPGQANVVLRREVGPIAFLRLDYSKTFPNPTGKFTNLTLFFCFSWVWSTENPGSTFLVYALALFS